MQIIPALDPGEARRARFRSSLEMISIQHLTFESREDALGHRVVEAVPDTTHRGPYAELRAAGAEGNRGVLP